MILKKIFVFVLFSIFSTSLFAIQESKIIDTMKLKINSVIEILQDKTSTKDKKTQKIFMIMDEVFDYKIMSQISLGNDWKKLNSEEKDTFAKVFENKLKNSYIDKLDLYTNQDIEVSNIEKLNPKRIKLITFLIGKDNKYEIEYKFYKNSKEDWLIYDVNIIGVSIMQTYRQQFASYLNNNTFKELIASLNK